MKYGLLNVEWEEIGADEAVSLARAVGEAGAVHQVADRYKAHAKEAVQLEKALEKLDKALSSQEEAWRKGTACLAEYDGDGFVDEVCLLYTSTSVTKPMSTPTNRPAITAMAARRFPKKVWLKTRAAMITSAVALYSPVFNALCGSAPLPARMISCLLYTTRCV